MKKIICLSLLLVCGTYSLLKCQSFGDEKNAAINFIKRAYKASPFEGVKTLEGEETNYYVVAVRIESSDIKSDLVSNALLKAQVLAEQGLVEPSVKYEMIEEISNQHYTTYLFTCETLSSFIINLLRKKMLDGAKIISAPSNKFITSIVTLENSKYSSNEQRDKVAYMKAKQYVNTLVNGSTITSDFIIRTDEKDKKTELTSIEIIKEHSMGFIQGLELLLCKEIIAGKTTYVYFSKI